MRLDWIVLFPYENVWQLLFFLQVRDAISGEQFVRLATSEFCVESHWLVGDVNHKYFSFIWEDSCYRSQ